MSGSKSGDCGGTKGRSGIVRGIATQFQNDAKTQLDNDSGNVDEYSKSVLIGKPEQGQYKHNNGNSDNELKEICKLDKTKHSNDKREKTGTDKYEGPCTGKDKERFKIGQKWEPPKNGEVNDNHKNVLIPPRRLGMCTSNLEHLDVEKAQGLQDKEVNHSFTGDVLLTAKEEAQKIIDLYKQQNSIDNLNEKNHKDTVCNAMKASFADLGDIIRGRDLWKNNEGMQKIENNLDTIFQKIKEKVTKGANHSNAASPYTKLREDWWSANRHQIWKAMTTCGEAAKIECNKRGAGSSGPGSSGPTRNGPGNGPGRRPRPRSGGGGHTNSHSYRPSGAQGLTGRSSSVDIPYHDYVPQKLRWLTEWAEWYCKKQSQVYKDLEGACEKCKSTINGNTCNDCEKCNKACTTYKNEIDKWKEDWDTQKSQYLEYYKNATTNGTGGKGKSGDDLNTQYLNQFLKLLHDKNSGATGSDPYGSAGGYIDNETQKTTQCQVQKQFCGNNTEKDNVFRQYPNGYDAACGCQPPVKLPPCTDNKILDTATYKQLEAQNEWKQRDTSSSGSKGGSSLVGDISKATFKGTASNLSKEDICKLEKDKHTNDWRDYKQGAGTNDTSKHDGPCSGKGNRFVIGEKWEKRNDMNPKHSDVLLPPRRQHMCTSNLENLGASGLTGASVNHSFLGDVLLAAKEEGNFIRHNIGDTSRVCNAMKYSFADLGDIIRGKDLWSNERGMKELEQHLQKIFGKIKDTPGIQDKYKDESPPYKKLRDDWWNANRDQIWQALTCDAPETANLFIPSSDITKKQWKAYKCGRDKYIPVDDYIPQRLRWMTEWTENYCKQLEWNYRPLKFLCGVCKKYVDKQKQETNKGNMTENRKDICKRCVANCKVYKQHVDDWQPKWNTMKQKYEDLYKNSSSSTPNDEITKETKEFLQTVKNPECTPPSTDSNDYQNLSEYVTSMGGNKNCIDAEQKEFGEDKKTGDEGAFRETPNKYKEECKWTDKTDPPKGVEPSPEPKTKDTTSNGEEPCTIVEGILKTNNGNQAVGHCNPKNNSEYPKWDCTKNIDTRESGACMPPRRQKLCIAYLTQLNTSSTKDDLRKALIQCAAAETFLHWNYYKEHGRGKDRDAEQKLKEGYIPDDFMRSMFYTYGDFRDMCLKTDIGSSNDTKNIGDTVTSILKNSAQSGTPQTPENFWEEIKKDVWKGMVCGLSYHIKGGDTERKKLTDKQDYQYTNLENVDPTKPNWEIGMFLVYMENIPQFLRWFTEWSDEFCQEQLKQYIELHNKCHKCQITSSSGSKKCKECKECQDQCKLYKQFIEKWMKDYVEQSKHYNKVKNEDPYKDSPLVEDSTHAYRFLYQSLQLFGVDGDCMRDPSTQKPTQHTSTTTKDMPQSLDEYPSGYDFEKKCECQEDTKNSVTTTASGPTTSSGDKASGQHVDGSQPGGAARSGDSSNPTSVLPNPNPNHPSSSGGTQVATPQDICKEVETYITQNNQQTSGGCKQKNSSNTWNCNDKIDKKKHDGACMPPRRQKMCIHYLEHMIDGANNKEEELKKALIQCAAIETYWLWEQYKGTHSGVEKQLKDGEIPPEFKRQMFYTYSDFKDLCLGNDMGKDNGTQIKDKVKKALQNGKSPPSGTQTPSTWWKTVESQITTNRFAKQTGGDPIMNQLVLFDKWLDRHRDMCNQWNNKEEMLSKLNEEWKNENKEHVLDIPLNDNAIHKINDETYNMINENTNKLNDITSLEDFGSTNIPYSALIRQNNDSQRQNLRTNISMDIHFDENNNNVTNEDDQLENSYNF
ncbi:erythrocyte membrane protein 1, PfEMP1, putative [Plasmodium sp. DRC-Itaito]|nr:erythrocyte membrane protein 1, PfEMP1, putative [Plasmodium sp. DRC-Itaito]